MKAMHANSVVEYTARITQSQVECMQQESHNHKLELLFRSVVLASSATGK